MSGHNCKWKHHDEHHSFKKRCKLEKVKACEPISDHLAKKIEAIWRANFPFASILPEIGLPSNDLTPGVVTIAHTSNLGGTMKFNGLPIKSLLGNAALYSAEVSRGHFVNIYETMLPDIPGKNGAPSTAEIYVKILGEYGLTIDGDHYHWKGAAMVEGEHGIFAIHHKAIDIDPIEFTKATIDALTTAEKVIKKRTDGKHA